MALKLAAKMLIQKEIEIMPSVIGNITDYLFVQGRTGGHEALVRGIARQCYRYNKYENWKSDIVPPVIAFEDEGSDYFEGLD